MCVVNEKQIFFLKVKCLHKPLAEAGKPGMDHPFQMLRGNWWVLSTFYRTVGSLCQGTQPSFTALAIASKTQHLPRAFHAGENSSPALKVLQ